MQEFLENNCNTNGKLNNQNRIKGFIRIFSINICFFMEAVTNEFDG
jgi:hypothetical protein